MNEREHIFRSLITFVNVHEGWFVLFLDLYYIHYIACKRKILYTLFLFHLSKLSYIIKLLNLHILLDNDVHIMNVFDKFDCIHCSCGEALINTWDNHVCM